MSTMPRTDTTLRKSAPDIFARQTDGAPTAAAHNAATFATVKKDVVFMRGIILKNPATAREHAFYSSSATLLDDNHHALAVFKAQTVSHRAQTKACCMAIVVKRERHAGGSRI